jgi:predicted nucleic acid-binding protein
MILIDANVLIDIIEDKSAWTNWSKNALIEASRHDAFAVNFIVYAEIAFSFANKEALDIFLNELNAQLLPISDDVAYLAAQAHRSYKLAGGLRTATLPDFFIGAHANSMGYPLLTRDPKRIRTYFPNVKLITPE